MRFGRKSTKSKQAEKAATEAVMPDAADAPAKDVNESAATNIKGPFDVADVDLEDGVQRVDLTSLIVPPAPGLELRLQVQESDGQVQSILLAGKEGAVELRVFAAQRGGDMWSEVRQQIAAETSRQGGTATEVEGSQGTELQCRMTVKTSDGRTGIQPTRVVGFNGPRWFLRATYLGEPALEPEKAGDFERAVESLIVRRGDGPMAPGEPLPINLPPQARRVQPES